MKYLFIALLGFVATQDFPCPSGAAYFDKTNRCFFFGTSLVSWTDARAGCHRWNAELASIHSTAEADFISKNMRINAPNQAVYWNGMNKIGHTNFSWIDNTVIDYTNWALNIPQACVNGPQDCVSISSHDSLWYNCWPCDHLLPFVCETPVRTPVTTVPTTTKKAPVELPAIEERNNRMTRLNVKIHSSVDENGVIHFS